MHNSMQDAKSMEPCSKRSATDRQTSQVTIPRSNETADPIFIVDADNLSEESKRKLEVMNFLQEPCDRKTYGERLRSAASKLNCSVRSVQRLMKKWEEEGTASLNNKSTRRDKGIRRISEEWQEFIIKTYGKGKRTPAQVFQKVKTEARQAGMADYPSRMTVYRILKPIIERQEQKKNIRNVGWKGGRLSLKTRDGEVLEIEYSNQVWQVDHTRADILLVDKYKNQMGRPWLTIVIDTYSRAIIGFNLGFDAPSSKVVALALRHAILQKQYGSEYKLYEEWSAFGIPEHLFTDAGKDFRSNHLQQIGVQLGFTCHLRDRPSEGGIVERPFGTFNTEFFSTLPGYTGSNVQERPPEAEKDACLTLRELERLFVAYITNTYNQRLDARMGNQTRIQRWEAGLLNQPFEISVRELDICLMRQTRRTIYRGGYLNFKNLSYRGEELAEHAGKNVVLRYDPRDVTQMLVYGCESDREVYLGIAQIQNFEGEAISLDEVEALGKQIRQDGKAVNNDSILDELHDREAFVEQKKKSRREIQKEEQAEIQPIPQPIVEPEGEECQAKEVPRNVEIPKYEIWDFDDD